jgi:hypothetical protein
MYEIGDMVMFATQGPSVDWLVGKIVGWEFDEGDIWTVKCEDGRIFYKCNYELSPYVGAGSSNKC